MKTLSLAMVLGFLPVLSGDPTEIGFGTLAGFDYEEGMELPSDVTTYDSTTVKISGFMRREDGGDGPTEYFMLINDACGCDGTPKLNEIVYCTMPSGEGVEIESDVVSVTGTIYVGEESEDGVVLGIYFLDVDSIGK